jgi:hypothetical protein
MRLIDENTILLRKPVCANSGFVLQKIRVSFYLPREFPERRVTGEIHRQFSTGFRD